MLCPKCKIEAENKRDSQGNWSAFCRNPQCADYGRVIKVILPCESLAIDTDAELSKKQSR